MAPSEFRETLKPIVGTLVDYWSNSLQTWIPGRIIEVDGESGAVRIDTRPKIPFKKEEYDILSAKDGEVTLRSRTRPSIANLERIRSVLRDGEMMDEARKLFDKHATGAPPMLRKDSVRGLASDIDAAFDTVGNIVGIKAIVASGKDGGVDFDIFAKLYWDLMWGVQKAYGNALSKSECVQTRRCADPRETYDFQRTLGEGTYGEVHLAKCKKTGCRRAVKKIPKDNCCSGQLEKMDPEIQLLQDLDHPHIVKLYECFDHGQYAYLVMDWCSGGDLADVIKNSQHTGGLSEDFVREVMRQTLLAITYVHVRGIVHLDLKGANIMLMPSKGTLPPAKHLKGTTMGQPMERPHVMIIDLGVAQFFRPGEYKDHQPMGTPATMAPEVWWGVITPKADVFSLGVVLFEMLSGGQMPFHAIDGAVDIYEDAKKYWCRLPQPPMYICQGSSQSALSLCSSMLTYDRESRPSAAECLPQSFLSGDAGYTLSSVNSASLPQDIYDRLMKLPRRSIFYKSVALAIARSWPSNQNPTVKKTFEELDVHKVGQLDKKQIQEALIALNVDEHLAADTADCMDFSRNGTVDWTEFVAACLRLGDDTLEEDLHKIFKQADSDGDGLLQQGDLKRILASDALRGEATADVFMDVAGRIEPGSRIDWATFRKQFRSVTAESMEEALEEEEEPVDEAPRKTPEDLQPIPKDLADIKAYGRGVMEIIQGAIFQETKHKAAAIEDTIADLDDDRYYNFEDNLRRLAEMGMDEREKNTTVLRKHRNVLDDKVISELCRYYK